MRLLICLVAFAFSAGVSAAAFSGLKTCSVQSSCAIQRSSECVFARVGCQSTAITPEQVQLCENYYKQCISQVQRSCTICTSL